MICYRRALKRKANGEKERKILRERGNFNDRRYPNDGSSRAIDTSRPSLSARYLIRRREPLSSENLTDFSAPARSPQIPESLDISRELFSRVTRVAKRHGV